MRIIKSSKSSKTCKPNNRRSENHAGQHPVDQENDAWVGAVSRANTAGADLLADLSEGAESITVAGNGPSQRQKEFADLFAKGVRLLAMREHSVKEMTDKLKSKCESKDVVYAVVDQLRADRYLSDERFTESYIRSRANRGFGPIKIRSELISKGVSGEMIHEHLQINAAIWYDNAVAQYQKKYGDEAVSDYNAWSKRARFMQSRGFTMEHIQVALPTVEVD